MNQSDKRQYSLLDALITDLIEELPLESRDRAANLDENELRVFETILGKFLTYRLEKLDEQVNDELLIECIAKSGDISLDEVGASAFILKELWKRLQESHRLRSVK